PALPLILDDLGHITPDVKEVMTELGFPGMKVLLFSFGADLPTNPYAPHNYGRNCVVYTGTHDNNTIRGWFEKEAAPEDKNRLNQYTGMNLEAATVAQEMVRLAEASVANIAIIPLQDVLGLGSEARMNLPSRSKGNWGWRAQEKQLEETLSTRLLDLTKLYNRI